MSDVSVSVTVDFNDGVWLEFLSPEGEGGLYMTRLLLRVVNAAKQNCPVDTGRLRDSITWELGGSGALLEGRVGSNVEYAPYVELGTRHMAPRAFLRNAISSVVGQ